MRLKKIKLAGFKSFADPLVIPFPSQLVAVVGPNGCGKSNIIDAVRWVMGESSAKSLRGESMTDVIFKGSSQRKSVGQASVELIFDNSSGRFGSALARYQEIAVKRLLTRDGNSTYFLNGGQCRRRDIVDIFLGTGVGARAYSIIGQNTVSKLVEARPEELRSYLEEAAGVSKYKDRRRESMQRMQQTREHLERVEDIRGELGKQLERLEEQARIALRYKRLRTEARACKEEILAAKWQNLISEQYVLQQQTLQISEQYELKQKERATAIKTNTVLQGKQDTVNFLVQQKQEKSHQLAMEIARQEEMVFQVQRDKKRLEEEQAQLEVDLQLAKQAVHTETLEHVKYTQQVTSHQADVHQKGDQLAKQRQLLENSALVHRQGQEAFELAQKQWNEQQGEAQIQRVNLQHIEQQYQQTAVRIEKNNEAVQSINVDVIQSELDRLMAQQVIVEKKRLDCTEQVQNFERDAAEHQDKLRKLEQACRQHQDETLALTTERATLKATIRKPRANLPALDKWQTKPRLIEQLTVETPWQAACEFVLGEWLQAITVEPALFLDDLKAVTGCGVAFTSLHHTASDTAPYPRLLDKITGGIPHGEFAFEHVFAAETLEEAMQWLPTLSAGQSVVTKAGFWLGNGWVRVVNAKQQNEAGLLACQQTLTEVSAQLEALNLAYEKLLQERETLHANLAQVERAQKEAREHVQQARESQRTIDSDIAKNKQALSFNMKQQDRLQDERVLLQQTIEQLATDRLQAQERMQRAITQAQEMDATIQALDKKKQIHAQEQTQMMHVVETSRSALYDAQLQLDRSQVKLAQLALSVVREQQCIERVVARRQILKTEVATLNDPNQQSVGILTNQVAEHQSLQQEMMDLHQQQEAIQQQLSDAKQHIDGLEKEVAQQQECKVGGQLKKQALDVQLASTQEALEELSIDTEMVLSTMDKTITSASRAQKLKALQNKIAQLGAVNLVAIEEYETESARKNHLDAQHDDLTCALTMLETAIVKLDRETALRLEETFVQVNASFQAIFPKLFGGGRAKLEWTNENVLDAGVLVMAQPPGKRNSTIHLLSGGEKAMTAIALIFSFFQLNPSPFCLLDEVDAPLDDLNVGRFCDLVKDMSQQVQFLFITHNKVTMELAEQLIGVTMHEPGVSRMVAVDVEQAMAMAN